MLLNRLAMQVYALVASDEPGRVRYVGSTVSTLEKKLGDHLCDLRNQRGGKKLAWMQEVVARGAVVQIKTLSVHATVDELPAAELDWINLYWPTGDLVNGCKYTWRRECPQSYPWRQPSTAMRAAIDRLIGQ